MIRDYAYQSGHGIVTAILAKFKIEKPDYIVVTRFEVITPDSFVWRLETNLGMYYLYAEDFIPGIDHIKGFYERYIVGHAWELIEVERVEAFEDAAPVKSATTYQRPDDADEILRYAVSSGHDFVFLARSDEAIEDAQFSDQAPQGFS